MAKIGIALFAAFLGIVGAVLTIGGGKLVLAGGSPYYAVTGLAVLSSAIGLLRRGRYGAGAYGAMLAGTLAWAIWEAGLDPWALMPRLGGPALVGLLFLLPAVKRATKAPRWWVGVPAIAALVLLTATAVRFHYAESGLPGAQPASAGTADSGTWEHWGKDVEGTKYAEAVQIHTGNVKDLELAWRYDTNLPPSPVVSLQASPIAMDGRLYMCLESGLVAAIDQDAGKEIWRFAAERENSPNAGQRCRGVTYFQSVETAEGKPCHKRIVLATAAGQLIAVDAGTGKRCSTFARDGIADLHQGMGENSKGAAMPTSPPTLVSGVLVTGQSIMDFGSFDSPSGVIRGYSAETGELLWAWDAGRPGQTRLEPGETYTRDTPNAWGVFSGDEKLGLVYVGTGNSPPDYFSGMRSRVADEFTASIVAIDVKTGLRRWHFRTVHHDLWDYDIAAQSVAVDLPGGTPALFVPTKRGQIFVLDRRTGKPIDPVVMKKVPQGGVKGEWTAPTQPYTTGFPSVGGDPLRERDMWGITPIDQMLCRITYREAKYQGEFTPISTEPTITYPAVSGGINWGSLSIDSQRGLMAVNAIRFANINRLVPRKEGEVIKGGFEGGNITFPQEGTPYAFKSFPFVSPLFVPCQQPPYGTLSVFDIASRRLVWSKPLGTSAGSGPLGIASGVPLRMGAPNFGGSISTAGGLLFIAAAQDRKLRAFDIANGKLLWSATLPAIGAANPVTYVSPKTGRQYVVIAAGGHFAMPGPQASALVAYALPQD